jgi:serine/threonine protein kinase
MEEVRHNLNINLKLKENKIYPKYSDNDISMIDFDKDLPKVIPEYNKLSVDDFLILKLIGKGAYGKVFLVRKKDSEEVCAMKILKKKEMIKREQVIHVKTEKRIMEMVDHPFIVKLRYAFHNKQKLYIITNFLPGGELFFHLSRVERFNEASAKFYASQIVLALEYLHKMNIIYRE